MLWAQAFDRRVQLDHSICHGIADGIRIKAAVDLWILANKRLKPARRWSGPGCGDAIVTGIDHKATDCVDGGLTPKDLDESKLEEIFL